MLLPYQQKQYMDTEQETIWAEVNRGLLEVFTPQKSTNSVSIAGSDYDQATFQLTQRRRRYLFSPRQWPLIQCLINYTDYIILDGEKVMDGELWKM